MDVYLVPVGADKHELYCEVPDDEDPGDAASAGAPPDDPAHRPNLWRRLINRILGFFRRMRDGFNEMLAEAERERREARTAAAEPATWWRTHPGAGRCAGSRRASPSSGCSGTSASRRQAVSTIPTTSTKRGRWPCSAASSDAISSKHRFWLTIDGLGFVASGVAFFVPGPNVIAYYFAFRLVGHYFSLRGARQGLSIIEWTPEQQRGARRAPPRHRHDPGGARAAGQRSRDPPPPRASRQLRRAHRRSVVRY